VNAHGYQSYSTSLLTSLAKFCLFEDCHAFGAHDGNAIRPKNLHIDSNPNLTGATSYGPAGAAGDTEDGGRLSCNQVLVRSLMRLSIGNEIDP
jgi:hypothetical protein